MGKTIHGGRGTRLYRIWKAMKTRCYNPNYPKYKNYAGKGIIICEEWKTDFAKFREWAIQNGYADNLTIDRINNNGNYEPSNCRWVTNKIQSNNRDSCRYITYKGETHTLTEWAEINGMSFAVLEARINRYNWSFEKAIQQSVRRRRGIPEIEKEAEDKAKELNITEQEMSGFIKGYVACWKNKSSIYTNN